MVKTMCAVLHYIFTIVKIYYLLAVVLVFLNAESVDEYDRKREEFFKLDYQSRTGYKLKLNIDETKVNSLLTFLKSQEIKIGFQNGTYPPSMHFFKARKNIEHSKIFDVIRTMPKGAALHLHDMSMTDVRWLIQYATYLPNCYMCFTDQGNLQFKFFNKLPKLSVCSWKLVSEVRKTYSNPVDFDNQLYLNLTLVVDNPDEAYPNINKVWPKFQSLFRISSGLIFYSKVFSAYYLEALNEFYEDNVQYMEFRAMLPQVYELDGTQHDQDWVISKYYNLTKSFQMKHKDFSGVKIIYSSSRSLNSSSIHEDIKRAIVFSKRYPDFFSGYDLVGSEEGGHSLLYFLKDLLLPSQSNEKLKYYFHAGETDWSGSSVDRNIIDAVLLNTSRIGHGYAIYNHPGIKKIAREKDIPIEICPISNQVLKLVADLRNHPGGKLMVEGYPVVISSDDPALWGARGLSYDWYEAYMGLGGNWADLRTLKQLAMDSLKYSSMCDQEKKSAFELWQRKWDSFIKDTVQHFNL